MAEQIISNTKELVAIPVEQLKELGDYALGLKLLVRCHEATYTGVCNDILHDSRELVLEQVCIVNTGRHRLGLVILFYQDIISVNIIGVHTTARKRVWKEIYGEDKNYKTLLMKQILPPPSCDENADEISVNEEDSQSEPVEISLLPHFTTTVFRPTKWKIIDTFEEDYKILLHDFKREYIVSVFGCGLKLGRRGTLAWVCLETGSSVYLFDVAKLGIDAFLKSEVGMIFNDETKVKVVHNGRKLEDYLHHQHHLNIRNVFDTQASDIYLATLNQEKQVPLLVKSLSSLLQQYLNLPKTSISNTFPEIEDESMWLERPLPEPLVVFLVHSVIFLRELREAMLKLMLVNLERMTKAFLCSLRDKPSAVVDHIEEQIVPAEIQNMFKQPLVSKAFKINYVK